MHDPRPGPPLTKAVARLRVTFLGADEALTFHTGTLDAAATAAVISACARFAFAYGLTLRIQRIDR